MMIGANRHKAFYLFALILLNAHSFFTMPDWNSDTWQILGQMARRDLTGIEPYAFAVFVLFGMFSVLLAALIIIDGQYQRFPAWPFALSLMVLGPSMAFLYQIFRRTGNQPVGSSSPLEVLALSRILPAVITAITIGALWDGRGGDYANLSYLFQTDYFTHAMLIDEAIFILLTPVLVVQVCRRQQRAVAWAWLSLLIPIFGACAFLVSRPPQPRGPSA